MSRLRILLVSRSKDFASKIERLLHDHARVKVRTKVLSNGHLDPLHDVAVPPDVLLLQCDSAAGELQYLAESRAPGRPPLIVIGPPGDADAMRLAMRAGASDYLTSQLHVKELTDALERVSDQISNDDSDRGELVTILNSRGGSGASFLAANLAYCFHSLDDIRTLLVDFDLQFGGLSRYFDLNPRQGVIEALDAAADLDEVSGESYITRHKSGMRLLAACTDSLSLANEISINRVDILLRMLVAHNAIVVVNLPRRIDPPGAMVLESSDHILLVVQQSLSHLHDAIQMIRLITQELRVPANRIIVVVNRYNKKSIIELNDVREALKVERIVTIPDNHSLVDECMDAGKPLIESAKNSDIARAISALGKQVRGIDDAAAGRGFLARALPSLLKGL